MGVLFALIVFNTLSHAHALNTTRLSRLTIDGNAVKNAQNQQVYFKGTDFSSRNFWFCLDGAPAMYSQAQQDQYRYMSEWNATAVTLSVSFPPFSDEWTSTKLDNLEAQVEYAAQNGLYSIIDCYESYNIGWIFGDFTEADWTTWKSAWADVATRFAGNPNVIYGIAVEPAGISAETYVTRLRECIDVIRAIDPNVIIICEGLSVDEWYDDGLNFQRTIGVNRPNIMFDIHKYYFESETRDPSYANIVSELETQGALWCLNNGYPVMSQQCNYDSRNVPNGETWFRNLLQVFNDYPFTGYTAWLWGTYQKSGEWLNLCVDWFGHPSDQGLLLRNFLPTVEGESDPDSDARANQFRVFYVKYNVTEKKPNTQKSGGFS